MAAMNAFLSTPSPTAHTCLSLLLLPILLSLYVLYRTFFPAPIPGIPRNHHATGSPLGDIPSMRRYAIRTGEPFAWLRDQTKLLQAPLVQVFLRPLGARPFLILADFRESQDILLRRGKEFDRSSFTREIFGGAAPNHHIIQRTDSPIWKMHRRLLQDLMKPAFLNEVGAPAVYASVLNMVQLWGMKAQAAQGKPFDASMDMYHVTLDAVLGFSFGESFSHSATRPQVEMLKEMMNSDEMERIGNGHGSDHIVYFPSAPLDDIISATLDAAAIIEDLQRSPFPRLTYWWLSRRNGYKTAQLVKNRYIMEALTAAVGRLTQNSNDETWVRSAVDHIVSRERKLAEKDGREPDFYSNSMIDEVFGFIVAGHDTTSTSLLWGLKLLADNPEIQNHLRAALQSSHLVAMSEKRAPTMKEITSTRISYVDATIEEILRCGVPSPAITREAIVDTQLLGYNIPKGTNVFMMANGASFFEDRFEIAEEKRSVSSQQKQRDKRHSPIDGAGNDCIGLKIFNPARWLIKRESDEKEENEGMFDSTAAPQLAFGLGTRGCYGKRLAYIEMKIVVTLLMWHFELLPTPENLSRYEAVDGLTHKPKQCFVRLKAVDLK